MKEEAHDHVVLVTGGTGLVGKGIEAYITKNPRPKERWVFVGSKDADLRKRDEVVALFERVKPTHVIHLAAAVGGLFMNMRRKVEMFRDNIAIDDNVMSCCHEFKVEKCMSCLSTCIFPDKIQFPVDESVIHTGPPHPTNEGYAYAKRMIDVLGRAYNEEYPGGCKFTSIVPTNIFGPHDNYHLVDSHVIPGLIHKTYLAKKNGEDLTVWGSGKPLRQFIYSEDLASLIVWALQEYNDLSQPIILSVGEEDEISIKDVAQIVVEAMEFKGKLIFDTSKADGQFKKTASNKKLLSLNPNTKFTPIREAIKVSCKWFIENYEHVRK